MIDDENNDEKSVVMEQCRCLTQHKNILQEVRAKKATKGTRQVNVKRKRESNQLIKYTYIILEKLVFRAANVHLNGREEYNVSQMYSDAGDYDTRCGDTKNGEE